MERRVVLAVALMVVVLFAHLWVQERFFSSPREAERPAPAQPSSEGPTAKAPRAPAPGVQGQPPAPPTDKPALRKEIPLPPAVPPPQTTARVETPLYRAVVSSEGGKFQEWTLKYRGDKPLVEVGEQGPRGLLVGRDEASAEPVAMALKPQTVTVDAPTQAAELVLSGEAHGLRVRETLRFRADTFTVEAHVRLENHGGSPRTVAVALPWMVSLHGKQPPEKFLGQRPTEVVWSTQGHVERVEDLTAVGRHNLQGQWIAMGSKWYLAALVPKTDGFRLVAAGESKNANGKNGEVRVTIAVSATPTVAAGQSWEGRVVGYIGPKEYDRLAAAGLEDTLNFGGFPIPRKYGGLPMEWLGVPILKLMNWLHGFVPNYGVVIILLTVVSKVLFFPLTLKSMRSMKAMQSLQPLVNNLRNKYRSDPRKLQEETLALYRKHSVNPMGGCLPMVAQVPIFYALYLALDVSVELQGAEFLCFGRMFDVALWICDLSSYDPTYILPVLMGISMFVQQKMTPTMGDPRQAKMMLFLPFIFTFMFLNLPSGLVLYWFVSNVLQILQQWWMDRAAARTREAKDVARS
ncbi:MAG: membrane protein insertase YidC [Candidatus Rokuibacteriota bacterium]